MTKSNKHTVQLLLTDKLLGNIPEVNNITYTKGFAATAEIDVKTKKRLDNRPKEPACNAELKREIEEIRCKFSI